jgi:tRNA (guanine10-N2)-methyltransferase
VDLKKPQHVFWYLESDKEIINNGLPPVTQKLIIFGRKIGNSERNLITKYELSKRNYLGPTAMDAELAFLMANQALVRPGKFVFDPFVGTGSILVAAAHFGAITIVSFKIMFEIRICITLKIRLITLENFIL